MFLWSRHYRITEWVYWMALASVFALGATAILSGFLPGLFDGSPFDRQFIAGLTITSAMIVLVASSAIGIFRWRRDRYLARDGLVVPYFHEFAGAKDRGEDVRMAILDALGREDASTRDSVHPIGAIVDLGDTKFAARLLKTLKAHGLVHGRAVDRSDGGWSVHARLARPANTGITHFDWHTMDETKGHAPWQAWFSGLPSTFNVSDEEFPLALTRDLAALMRTLAAMSGIGDSIDEIEQPLRDTLELDVAGDSAAWDEVRLSLAQVLAVRGDLGEALDLLRSRIQEGTASGELLRTHAMLLTLAISKHRDEIRELAWIDEDFDVEDEDDLVDLDPGEEWKYRSALEQIEQLEESLDEMDAESDFEVAEHLGKLKAEVDTLTSELLNVHALAASQVDDPRSDLSLYNLVTATLTAAINSEGDERDQLRREAWNRLDELVDRSSFYRGTWYVKRLRGLRAWMLFQAQAEQENAHGDIAVTAASEAAKWYSRAIAARPRYMLVRYEARNFLLRRKVRSRRSPILDANAVDAHFYAGHRWRARYHELRFRRRRRRLWRQAVSDLSMGYLGLARTSIDWTIVGRHEPDHDRRDALENTSLAVKERIESMMEESVLLARDEPGTHE